MMIMLSVITLALTTMFVVLTQTINFSYDTESRIKAVNLAREWIEAVTNIRNTNWLRFSSDRKNCWDSKNYSNACFNPSTGASTNKINANEEYILISKNWAWELWTSLNKDVYVNWSWTYYQWTTSGPTILCKNTKNNNSQSTNCKSPFQREIKITKKNNDSMDVAVTVTWFNGFGKRKVELTSTLTNWKSNYDNY